MFKWLRELRARRRAAFVADVIGIMDAEDKRRADIVWAERERRNAERHAAWLATKGVSPDVDRKSSAETPAVASQA